MKVIESLDEWWEAIQAKRLEMTDLDGEWRSSQFNDGTGLRNIDMICIADYIKTGQYRWGPEQIKLFELDIGGTVFWKAEGQITSFASKTGRTVIAEVITDGE